MHKYLVGLQQGVGSVTFHPADPDPLHFTWIDLDPLKTYLYLKYNKIQNVKAVDLSTLPLKIYKNVKI